MPLEHDSEHRDQNKQEREEGDKAEVGEQSSIVSSAVLPIAQEHGYQKGCSSVLLLPDINASEQPTAAGLLTAPVGVRAGWI